jgi:hypothetical protein
MRAPELIVALAILSDERRGERGDEHVHARDAQTLLVHGARHGAVERQVGCVEGG